MVAYFNPRPPWGGRRNRIIRYAEFFRISIHALRGEGDTREELKIDDSEISIHALRGEGDKLTSRRRTKRRQFQSTPSVGRATTARWHMVAAWPYFNPRPPWGGRCAATPSFDAPLCISIHALRGEGDQSFVKSWHSSKLFQSTPSVGRATYSGTRPLKSMSFQSTPSVGRATI